MARATAILAGALLAAMLAPPLAAADSDSVSRVIQRHRVPGAAEQGVGLVVLTNQPGHSDELAEALMIALIGSDDRPGRPRWRLIERLAEPLTGRLADGLCCPPHPIAGDSAWRCSITSWRSIGSRR